MNLTGSTILITGGSLGIGKATAALLARSGARVFITGRSKERIEAAAELTGSTPIVADVGNEQDAERTVNHVIKVAGSLDCLINNAGVGGRASIEALQAPTFERIWQTNVLGAALMAKYAAPVFIRQRS